jgi:hypothetical protein
LDFVLRWLVAFGVTVAVEVPIVTLLLPRAGRPRGRRVALALVAQAASHPAVWFVFPELPLRYAALIALAESWAVLSEAAIYRALGDGVGWRRAFGVSLLANGASYLVSLLLG